MKIAVYAIALNEAKHVARWAKATAGADIRIVADTGSTDNTVQLLNQHRIETYEISVVPFRFDDARNAALALVPADVDICVSLDMDEVPDPDFFDKLREHWQPDTDRAWVMWDTGTIWANNNRVHARHGFRWIKPCHEVPVLSKKRPENDIVIQTLVKHVPDDSKPRTQYLGMLEWAVEEDPSDPRMLAYLAREYYFHSRWEDVIRTARTLRGLVTGWNVERAATWRNAGFSFQQLGDIQEAEQWYRLGTETAPEQIETWFSLAQFLYTQERWEDCLATTDKGLSLKPDAHYLSDESTTWRLHDLKAIACWNLDKKGSAKKHGRIALELNPDEQRLKDNYAFMVSSVVKEYKDGL